MNRSSFNKGPTDKKRVNKGLVSKRPVNKLPFKRPPVKLPDAHMQNPHMQIPHMVVADKEFEAVSEGRIRIRIGMFTFVFMLVIFVLRFAEISLFTALETKRSLPPQITTTRADIFDRNGEMLATTLQTYSLFAEPKRVWNVQETADRLLEIFPNQERSALISKLSSNRDFVWLQRGLTPQMKQVVFDIGLPGIDFRIEPKRVYPLGHTASHIIGFTDLDLRGRGGAERAFDTHLSSVNAPPKTLSIDIRVQHALSEALRVGLARYKANSNSGVVLNIKTGEILAMASLPNYNPNNVAAFSDDSRFNHASMSTYDLGSVFKPITMALALETGVTDLTEEFPVQDPLKVRNNLIRDDHYSAKPMAMPEILAQSSNRGTALLAIRSGAQAQIKMLKDLGLFDRVPFELLENAKPQLQSEWQDITLVTVSYGHGISVTPLALAVAMGALLNGGEYIAPTIAKRSAANPAQPKRVVSEQTSQHIRDLMRFVVTDGTGKNAAVKGYGVMGKTGTADKPSYGGYDEKRLVSSFVGAFPYEDPTYLVMITYDEPKIIKGISNRATAGWNAAPTTRNVIERIAPILGVERRLDPIAMSPFSKGSFPNESALP